MLPLSIPKDIDKYFFNRKNDIKQITYFTNSIYQDLPSQLLITGRRGVGKTFLLKKILQDQKDDILTVYIDISRIYANTGGKLSEELILKEFYKELFEKINEDGENDKIIEKIKDLINNLRIKDFTLDKDSTKIYNIPIPVIKNNYQKLSDFVMNLPQKIVDSSDKYKGVIVVFDEFQHLKYLENSNAFFWLFRSYVQMQSNVSYIFTGSISKTAEVIEMINGQTGAFGGRMIQIDILPFSKEETERYLNEKAHEIEFIDDGFDRFYEFTKGVPSIINSFVSVLNTGDVYDGDRIKEISILKNDQILSSWLYVWGNLNKNEKNIIKCLVINDELSLSQLADSLSISKNTIIRYLDQLANKSIVKHENGMYLLNDDILKTWIENKKEIDGYYPI